MKRQIRSQLPFDLTILGCGGYGHPLQHFIVSELGKPAIYIGGATQLLFGIRGTRWDEHEELSKLIKINWVSPMLSEIPPLPGAVEDSAYWSQPTIGGRRSHTSRIHLIARLNTPLIQLLHDLENSGYSHHDPTLTIHIVSDQHESHNDRALQVAHEANFSHGAKIVKSWPHVFHHRLCVEMIAIENTELTLVIDGSVVEHHLPTGWYTLLSVAWRRFSNDTNIGAFVLQSNEGVFAPIHSTWSRFITALKDPKGSKSDEVLERGEHLNCYSQFVRFVKSHKLQIMSV